MEAAITHVLMLDSGVGGLSVLDDVRELAAAVARVDRLEGFAIQILDGRQRRLIGRTARVKLDEAAAESLPFADANLDLVVSSFLLHELPQEIRGAAIAEMARVVKPDGLVVIVDSIQKGDRPEWDGLLDLFPYYFHEPYYADYVTGSLEGWGATAGLAPVSSENAFLSKVAVFTRA